MTIASASLFTLSPSRRLTRTTYISM